MQSLLDGKCGGRTAADQRDRVLKKVWHFVSSAYWRVSTRKEREQEARWGFRMKKGVLSLLFWFGSSVWEGSVIYLAESLPRLEHCVTHLVWKDGVQTLPFHPLLYSYSKEELESCPNLGAWLRNRVPVGEGGDPARRESIRYSEAKGEKGPKGRQAAVALSTA